MDKNRGHFSTDLESDWCNKETIVGGCMSAHARTHTGNIDIPPFNNVL